MSYEITQYSIYVFSANEALGFHSHILGETSVLPEATSGSRISARQTIIPNPVFLAT